MKKSIQLLAMLVGIIAILIPQACSDVDSNDGSLEQERLEVGRALLEMQASDVADLLPYYTDDVEYHDPIVDINGIQDMTAFLNQLIIGASPNLVTIVEDEILMNDTYSATWVMSGSFNGVPYQAKV